VRALMRQHTFNTRPFDAFFLLSGNSFSSQRLSILLLKMQES
jgi:hypothetical protein